MNQPNHKPLVQIARNWLKGILMRIGAIYRAIAIAISSVAAFFITSSRASSPDTRLAIEPLEPRLALSALGLVDAPYVPTGGLDGKIVYLHAGHGYTADNEGNGAWTFQRPENVDIGGGNIIDSQMIEDLGNYDQATFFADYLFRAGATIAPLRPIGHQTNEAILDNDDDRVTFRGNWSNSSASTFFGSPGDVPYRFASTSPTETAVARYQPDLPEAGFYPVYSWTRYGSDRAADQLYRIHHAGGETEVTVNHRRVGNGLVYLGTYYFEEGTGGYVEISNQSSEAGKVVIADMIRFGNGMGDIDRGGGISGRSREDEAGLYWVKWHVDHSQGIPDSEYRTSSSDRSATVSLAPRYAEYMNRSTDGSLQDRVFVSFHSNAGGGAARGVLGLYNGNNDPNTATPNQFFLANTLAKEVNDDLVAQNGDFEHNWHNRGSNVTLDRADIEFGEINNLRIAGEFDATIIETGYHDNLQDIQMLRDPKVRDAIARATYQGLVTYFRGVDGNQTSQALSPAKVDGVWAASSAAGNVTVEWNAPVASSTAGGAATGYRILASTNGYAFDGGTFVAGGGTLSHTFTGLDPLQTYYFQVVAENAGGASRGSQVVAAKPIAADQNVLIVNGFDRLSRSLNPTEAFGGGGNTVERVRPRGGNSGDYLITVASAIQRTASTVGIASATNESVIAGDVTLSDYDAVIWMSGEESSADDTFNAAEQNLVEQYIAAGGNLFASGAEIGWDLDHLNNGRSFFRNTLGAVYSADDANTYTATGSGGGLLAGISLNFDAGQQFYDVNFADVLTPSTGATTIATYAGGDGAATQTVGTGARGDVILMGFPVESVLSEPSRDEVVRRVLESFGLPTVAGLAVDRKIDNSDPAPSFSTTGAWSSISSGLAEGGSYLVSSTAGTATATWQFDLAEYGQAEILVRSVASSSRADSALYRFEPGFGEEQLYANQTVDTGEWVSLGSFAVAAGTRTVSLSTSDATGGTTLAADAVRLVVTAAAPANGDFNSDGFVSAADYTIWRDALGGAVVRGTSPDANGDGTINALDYGVWKSQFGTTPPAANLTTVAEPTSEPSPPASSLLLAGLSGHADSPATRSLATPSVIAPRPAESAPTAAVTRVPVARQLAARDRAIEEWPPKNGLASREREGSRNLEFDTPKIVASLFSDTIKVKYSREGSP